MNPRPLGRGARQKNVSYDPVLGNENYRWTANNSNKSLSVFGTPGDYTYRVTAISGNLSDTYLQTLVVAPSSFTFDKQITLTAQERLSDVYVTNKNPSPSMAQNDVTVLFNASNNPSYDAKLPTLLLFLQTSLADSRGIPSSYVNYDSSTQQIIYNVAPSETNNNQFLPWVADKGPLHDINIDLNAELKLAVNYLTSISEKNIPNETLNDFSRWNLSGYYGGVESNDGSGASLDIKNVQITQSGETYNPKSINSSPVSITGGLTFNQQQNNSAPTPNPTPTPVIPLPVIVTPAPVIVTPTPTPVLPMAPALPISPTDPILPIQDINIPLKLNYIETSSPLTSFEVAELEKQGQVLSNSNLPNLIDGTLINDISSSTASISRMYLGLLGRPADFEGSSYWVHSDLTEDKIIQSFISSPEFSHLYPSLDNQSLLTSLYKNVLNRIPDTIGNSYWLNQFNNGASQVEVVKQFIESSEAKSLLTVLPTFSANPNVVNIESFYKGVLDRTADDAGLHYFKSLLGSVSLSDVARDITISSESQILHGTETNEQFVNSVYQNALGRPTMNDASGWTNGLNSGQMTRGDVLFGITQSSEGQQHFHSPL